MTPLGFFTTRLLERVSVRKWMEQVVAVGWWGVLKEEVEEEKESKVEV